MRAWVPSFRLPLVVVGSVERVMLRSATRAARSSIAGFGKDISFGLGFLLVDGFVVVVERVREGAGRCAVGGILGC